MRVDDVLVRVNDTRIHYEVGVINVIKVALHLKKNKICYEANGIFTLSETGKVTNCSNYGFLFLQEIFTLVRNRTHCPQYRSVYLSLQWSDSM